MSVSARGAVLAEEFCRREVETESRKKYIHVSTAGNIAVDRDWQYPGPCRIRPVTSEHQGRQDRRHPGSPMIGVAVSV